MIGALSFAQRDTREIIDAQSIKSIQINTNEVYLLNISTSKNSEIRIKTHSEGEYYDDIILESLINGEELVITTKYPEKLTGGFDKLSAHKIFSLEIEMEIPEGLAVSIQSNIASLQGKGNFKSIYASLKQGYCKLLDFSGTAVINTYSGNILVETSSGLIEADSRNGDVQIPGFMPGRNPIRLTSIDGDIKVRKK
ncbi:hypothetical protein GCM10011532_13300 [Christiangramia forsetii]|nr:hypothetical protein GCM10011532_13300 [Christiangramia forsetii]